jgi:hypothetical protein
MALSKLLAGHIPLAIPKILRHTSTRDLGAKPRTTVGPSGDPMSS